MGFSKAVYGNTLRWFLASTARIVVAVLFAFFAYSVLGGMAHLEINGMESGSFLNPGTMAAWGDRILWLLSWLLGVGIVRNEIQSGSLGLLLTRPLTRAAYLLSKWAALASLLLACLLFCHAVLLAKGGSAFWTADESGLFLAQAVQVLALAALVVCFSTLAPRLGEWGGLLVLLVLLYLGPFSFGVFHGGGTPSILTALRDFALRVLFPRVRQDGGVSGAFFPGAAGVDVAGSILFNLGVLAASLGLAWLGLERREFGYAEAKE